jgi:hypothetical protein
MYGITVQTYPPQLYSSSSSAARPSFHIYQAFRYRKGFCWVIIMGALWETLSFASRNPTKKTICDVSFLLLILAPLLINAFDYMLLGRMVQFFLGPTKLFGIGGSKMGVIFVCCDTMSVFPDSCSHIYLTNKVCRSFIVQIGGGLMSLSKTAKTAKLGLHVYTGGVVFQQTLIACFLALTIRFSQKLGQNTVDHSVRHGAMKLVRVLRCSLLLITVRTLSTSRRVLIFRQSPANALAVPHHLPHNRIFIAARIIIERLHQPPRILRLRL